MPETAQKTFTFSRGTPGEDSFKLWSPMRPDDYALANKVGRDAADEVIAYMNVSRDLSVVSFIAERITASGEFSGVETGFFTRIAGYTLA